MNVKDIVIEHLKAVGADGLCNQECGCGLHDFMPCSGTYGGPAPECEPAMFRSCAGCMERGECDLEGNTHSGCYKPMEVKP